MFDKNKTKNEDISTEGLKIHTMQDDIDRLIGENEQKTVDQLAPKNKEPEELSIISGVEDVENKELKVSEEKVATEPMMFENKDVNEFHNTQVVAESIKESETKKAWSDSINRESLPKGQEKEHILRDELDDEGKESLKKSPFLLNIFKKPKKDENGEDDFNESATPIKVEKNKEKKVTIIDASPFLKNFPDNNSKNENAVKERADIERSYSISNQNLFPKIGNNVIEQNKVNNNPQLKSNSTESVAHDELFDSSEFSDEEVKRSSGILTYFGFITTILVLIIAGYYFWAIRGGEDYLGLKDYLGDGILRNNIL